MKLLILLLLISSGYSMYLDHEFDVGTGDKLTLRIGGTDSEKAFYQSLESTDEEEDDDDEETNAEDDEEEIEEEEEKTPTGLSLNEVGKLVYSPKNITDHIEHDCMNVLEFDPENPRNLEPDWIGKHINSFRKVKQITQYNHAYGIPVFGQGHIKEETMKRACYLIRFLFADNEGMRRIAYAKGMYVYAERGGFATGQAANVGNSGLSCPCGFNPFPIRQIVTAAHEIAHWWLNRVGDVMYSSGYLKLPEFQNNEAWQWKDNYRQSRKSCPKKTKDRNCCTDVIVTEPAQQSKYKDYLYNSIAQDRLTVWKKGAGKKGSDTYRSKIACGKTHHYFIYTGQDNYLGMASGGKPKEALREQGKKKNPNLFALLDQFWQCKNTYLSVCEDKAHNWTKGPNTKLIIGKSDPEEPSKMNCDKNLDTKQIPDDQVETLKEVADADAEFERDEESQNWSVQNKCMNVLKTGTELGTPWLTTDNLEDINFSALEASLDDSNERAWWLRQCCATTAGFNRNQQ